MTEWVIMWVSMVLVLFKVDSWETTLYITDLKIRKPFIEEWIKQHAKVGYDIPGLYNYLNG